MQNQPFGNGTVLFSARKRRRENEAPNEGKRRRMIEEEEWEEEEEEEEEDEEDEEEERIFEPLRPPDDVTRTVKCQESLWCQHLSLERSKKALRVFTHFHAGPGQITAGDSRGRRIDALVVEEPGKFLLCQFHEQLHYYGHRSGCPREKTVEENDTEDPTDWTFEDDEEGYEPDEEEDFDEDQWRAMSSSSGFQPTSKTKRGDELLRKYAAAMNEAGSKARERDGDFPRIEFEVSIDYACDFFHGSSLRAHSGKYYNNLGELLRREHPRTSLTGDPLGRIRDLRIKESDLLEKLLTDDEYQGFVTLVGGVETRTDAAALATGFCLTKSAPRVEELGPHALYLSKKEGGKRARLSPLERLSKLCQKRELTMTKRNFPAGKSHTMTVQMLRFLVRNRGLRRFRLLHAMTFELRNYLYDFIEPVMRRRRALKKGGESGGLEEKCCKLLLNGMYGYYYVQSPNYTKTSVCLGPNLDKTLRRDAKGRVTSCALLGSVASKKKNRRDLVYALTKTNPNARIDNQIQLAGNILGNSKLIIFSHLLFLLSVLDPSLAQFVYMDTDSIMLFLAREKLEDCVPKELRPVWKRHAGRMFEDENNPGPQNGRLEVEGVFRGGFLRTIKCYRLIPLEDGEDGQVLRFRSVPRKLAEKLPAATFRAEPPPEGEEEIATSWRLGPTPTFEMALSMSSRSLGTRINYKRFSMVVWARVGAVAYVE